MSDIVREIVDAASNAIDAFQVVTHMSLQAGVSPLHVRGPSRLREFVVIRRKIAERLRAYGYSYPAIGRALGGRHHTTIQYMLGLPSKPLPRWRAYGASQR